ncbi:MAG: T9SS type A sorting domain-containing protein, partial [Chitinophagaceae bacterium]|nr:T9SS type A sorting domain-containing protein [Chitinophagaceae bacterium]
RFRQTSATQQFRIDDIYISFAILLPINLTSFSSTKNSSNTTLNWTANSSHASNSFILEKSNDAVNFSTINTQTAKGSGTYLYNYTDASFVANSKAFYRLQMKDVSGTISYSKILVVNPDKKKSDFIASLYPSPATNNTTIALNATLNGAASIEIFDAEGRKVATQTASLAQGLNAILIDVSMLKSGTYVLKASTKQQAQTMNLVVLQ